MSAGATIYIPRNVTIGLVNDGTEPLGITFTFSKPGFEELMRDNSVLEGQPVTPLSPEESARIRAKHRWHTIAGTLQLTSTSRMRLRRNGDTVLAA